MKTEKETWQKIQKSEIKYHQRKDPAHILEINLKYWKLLLSRIASYVEINPDTRVLDIGCGGCGILLAIEKGRLVGIDPLMNEYLQQFEFLKNAPITWICGAAEEMEFPEQFDVIFSINSLDHVYDPQKTADKINCFLQEKGFLVISLNCHNTDFFQWYYRRFYKYVDRYHPHHFRPVDLFKLFPEYKVLNQEDIDWIYLQQQDLYREKVLQKKGIEWKSKIRSILNPFKYPVALANFVFKRHVHRRKPDDTSIFSTYLFILQKY